MSIANEFASTHQHPQVHFTGLTSIIYDAYMPDLRGQNDIVFERRVVQWNSGPCIQYIFSDGSRFDSDSRDVYGNIRYEPDSQAMIDYVENGVA